MGKKYFYFAFIIFLFISNYNNVYSDELINKLPRQMNLFFPLKLIDSIMKYPDILMNITQDTNILRVNYGKYIRSYDYASKVIELIRKGDFYNYIIDENISIEVKKMSDCIFKYNLFIIIKSRKDKDRILIKFDIYPEEIEWKLIEIFLEREK